MNLRRIFESDLSALANRGWQEVSKSLERLHREGPIDWHLDLVTGHRAPRLHWSLIDPLDPQTVGDSKVVWELNRHQWSVELGQAFHLTGDERYAEAFASALKAWMEQNRPSSASAGQRPFSAGCWARAPGPGPG